MGRAHLEVLKSSPYFRVVGVASHTGVSAQRLAKEFRVENHGSDWKEMASATGARACVVTVSHLLNEKITSEAIGAGLHVLAEKPVSLDAASIRKLHLLAQQQGVQVLVGMNRRYYPSILEAINTVKYYGKIIGITILAPDPVAPYRSMGTYDSLVYDEWLKMNTIHAIDLFQMIGGDILDFQIYKTNVSEHRECSLTASLRFKDKLLGTFVSHSSYGGMQDWQVIIAGEGIQANIGPLEQATLKLDRSPAYAVSSAKRNDGLKPGLYEQATAFSEAINTEMLVWPSCDLEEHAKTIEFIESMKALKD